MIQNFIRFFTYLLILTFPIGVIFRMKLFTNAYIVPQDMIVLIIAILVLLHYISKKTFPKEKVILLLQAGFVGVGIVSLFLNYLFHKDINILVSLLYAFRYVLYASLIFIPDLFSKKLKTFLIIIGAVVLFIGFFQYFFFNDLLGLYYLGWDKHLYRLFATFLDPNFAGVYYVLFFFFLMISVVTKKIQESYFELILSFFTVIAIYLTYSRTALLALISGVIAYAIAKKKYKQLLLVLLFILTALYFFSDITVEGLNPLRTASSKGRLESYASIGHIIQKNPLTGVGFNAYRYAQIRYGSRSIAGSERSNADAGNDNSLLFVMATTGVVGLTLFIFSYFLLIRKILQKRNVPHLILFCSLIALFIASFFINALFYTPILTWVFLVLSQRKNLLS